MTIASSCVVPSPERGYIFVPVMTAACACCGSFNCVIAVTDFEYSPFASFNLIVYSFFALPGITLTSVLKYSVQSEGIASDGEGVNCVTLSLSIKGLSFCTFSCFCTLSIERLYGIPAISIPAISSCKSPLPHGSFISSSDSCKHRT